MGDQQRNTAAPLQSLPAFFVPSFYELSLATPETKWLTALWIEGLITLIHNEGTSKEMLSLRYNRYRHFLFPAFTSLGSQRQKQKMPSA